MIQILVTEDQLAVIALAIQRSINSFPGNVVEAKACYGPIEEAIMAASHVEHQTVSPTEPWTGVRFKPQDFKLAEDSGIKDWSFLGDVPDLPEELAGLPIDAADLNPEDAGDPSFLPSVSAVIDEDIESLSPDAIVTFPCSKCFARFDSPGARSEHESTAHSPEPLVEIPVNVPPEPEPAKVEVTVSAPTKQELKEQFARQVRASGFTAKELAIEIGVDNPDWVKNRVSGPLFPTPEHLMDLVRAIERLVEKRKADGEPIKESSIPPGPVSMPGLNRTSNANKSPQVEAKPQATFKMDWCHVLRLVEYCGERGDSAEEACERLERTDPYAMPTVKRVESVVKRFAHLVESIREAKGRGNIELTAAKCEAQKEIKAAAEGEKVEFISGAA